MLDFLQESSLGVENFNEKIEFIIPGFLPKRMITMVYADGGNGKSWFALGLAKYCTRHMDSVIYMDFDNPINVLLERNVNEKLIAPHSNLHYVHRSKCPVEPQDFLKMLASKATAHAFDDIFLIVDSLREFTDVMNDQKVMLIMNMLKNLREAGCTILILHHSNKDGKNYQGSNNIRNSVDNIYQLSKREMADGVGMLLSVRKERAAILDKAFEVNPMDLEIKECDLIEAQSSEDDLEFVNTVKQVLRQHDGINKSELLKASGTNKADKTARARLDRYDGTYWQSTRNHTHITYSLVV